MIKIVTSCADCPFLRNRQEGAACAVSVPTNRPLDPKEPRPSWCPLRREQIIVRDYK